MYFNNRGPEGFEKRVREDKKTKNEIQPRAWLELNTRALQKNYRAIQDQVPNQSLLPMVKANAYGHGLEWVGEMLKGFSNLYAFGVATLEEGAQLRKILGPRFQKTSIVVFSDTTPWAEEKGYFCEHYNLTPVIASEADWHQFLKQRWTRRISYEIQFNTGMNRLGVSPQFASVIMKNLKTKPVEEHPQGVFSHFSSSENLESKLTTHQLEKFKILKNQFSATFPSVRFHFANSGGIWNFKNLGLSELTDVVRPGLALYGIPPWQGAPLRGISEVMSFKTQVIMTHRLKPGESIGYGGTYTASGKEAVFAAIIGAGYADGVMRSLGNQGYTWVGGKKNRFLGTISMDVAAIQCSADTKIGSSVEILGPHIDIWAQSRLAGTIPYEFLTSISTRVKRVYE